MAAAGVMETRKPYPSDVSDEEWAFVAPYLTLMPLDAAQRDLDLRDALGAPRYLARGGIPWRMLPNDLPPWAAVYQQTQRWLQAGSFEAIVHDLRMMLRLAAGRIAQPSAAILDSSSLKSSPESGTWAGYDGAKRGFVLLPRRWVVERSFGWMSRFRRLARDYERPATTLAGLHFVAFACLLLHRALPILTGGS